MSQLFLFDAAPARATVATAVRAAIRKDHGPAPQQEAINLKKLLRKIEFKRRIREKRGETDDHQYSVEGIVKMHQYLLKEWQERFPVSTNLRDQYSYWSWMLGNPGDSFSFRDCLIADGYTRPDELIEALEHQAPDWFKAIQHLSELDQVAHVKKMVAESGPLAPALRGVNAAPTESDRDSDDEMVHAALEDCLNHTSAARAAA